MVRSGHEMHDYLITQVNHMLRRVDMYGGEPALWTIFDHLFYLEDNDYGFDDLRNSWRDRNAFTPTGLKGPLRQYFPEEVITSAEASIYAEAARNRGWLRPDRTLTPAEYADLLESIEPFAADNRTRTEILAQFGDPSIRFGGSWAGTALAYGTADVADPMVFFHLWSGDEPGAEPIWPQRREPQLLAIRYGTGRFPNAFHFTPEGIRLRPSGG